MAVTGVATFERFFRAAASLDIDKDDLRRFQDFVNQKIYDLLVVAEGNAKANGRDIIQPRDLPITKGLEECVHQFRKLDQDVGLLPILQQIVAYPPLDLGLGEDAEERLPLVAGGLSLALARTFKIVDPDIKNPQTKDWDTAFAIFGLLL
jgi:hypothetical protein